MAKTETQINLKINKGNYAKIQENLSQIGENELIIADDINIPLPDELNEGKGIISHNNKYVFEDVQLKNLITDIETHKTENGSYPSTKAVYDYCQTLGVPVIELSTNSDLATSQQVLINNVSQDDLNKIIANKGKALLLNVLSNNVKYVFNKVNEGSSYGIGTRFMSAVNDRDILIGEITNIVGTVGHLTIKKINFNVPIISLTGSTITDEQKSIINNNDNVIVSLGNYNYYIMQRKVNNSYAQFYALSDNLRQSIIRIDLDAKTWTNSIYDAQDISYKVDAMEGYENSPSYYPATRAVYNFVVYGQTIDVSLQGIPDLTQTYTFTLTSQEINKLRSSGVLYIHFVVDYDDVAFIYIKPQFLATMEDNFTFHSSSFVPFNNQQIIANISIDLSSQSNNATLSFSEIEGGGSGGGTGSSEKIYTYKMEWDSVDVGVGQTNILTFSVNENTIKGLPSVYQNLIDASDLVSAWNTIKAGVSGGSQDAFYQAMIFITMLSSFTFDKSLIEFDDNIDGSMKNITAITAVLGNDQTLEFSYNNNTNSVEHYSMALNDFLSSTITLLGSVGGSSSGGSSEGSGSGKLYDLSMELTRYDENGDAVTWTGDGAISTSTLPLTIHIYESNFEKIKEKFNDFIDLYNQTFGQSLGITIPHITDINSLVSFINTFVVETVADGDTLSYYLIQTLVNLSDKAYFEYTYTDVPFYFNLNASVFSLDYVNGTSNGELDLAFEYNSDDRYYALNAHNSCTLTEYGTSGGGGASATRTKYHIEVADSNDHKAIIPIYKDDFDKYLVEMNQVGQTMATAMGITWTTLNTIADIKNLFDAQKSTQLAYGCDLAMNLLVKYAYESGENPVLTLTNSTREQAKVVNEMLNYDLSSLQIPLAYPLGAITSISYDPESIQVPNTQVGTTTLYWWFKATPSGNSTIEIDQDATFTYTEEQVAGGSSSSQPTIPERFSLAYNLVVNINQEQFANGSWTGSNSDNIRTFQYNGSNADETKARELVEFLTGVPVLDSYNATKPTPCFVFCTQSNICWKLQWDNSLLHAYKVENFPFVVKEKCYNFVLSDNDGVMDIVLQINIPYETMQEVYDSINQVLGGNISTPQEVIVVYDSLKADNISAQSFGMLCQLFVGLANANLFNNMKNILTGGADDVVARVSGTVANNVGVGTTALFSQTVSSGHISFTSNSTLLIYERDSDELD